MTTTIGYFVGSLSAHSVNRAFAEALVALAPADVSFVEIPIADLPLYNHDLDGEYPPVAAAFKNAIDGVDGLLYVTPEYNRSIPGALKNAIDWASRPHGRGSLGKPSAIAGVSRGAVGTAVAQSHLRSIISFFQAVQYTQPELYIQWSDELIGADGVFASGTKEFLQGWMDGFVAFVKRQSRED